MTNIRSKGAGAEREVASYLNGVVHKVRKAHRHPEKDILDKHVQIQRNPNQAANGGSDLQNTYGLAIEIKRQESLSLNSWWNQCSKAALETKNKPILIYRQNHKKWQVQLEASVKSGTTYNFLTVTMDLMEFLKWFYSHVDDCLNKNLGPTDQYF